MKHFMSSYRVFGAHKINVPYNEAKSRKYQGVFEVKSRVKTWQVRIDTRLVTILGLL